MFDEKFDPVKAVLVNVKRNDLKEIELDISSKSSQVTQYLGGSATFIGVRPGCVGLRSVETAPLTR